MPSTVRSDAWFVRITLPHELLKQKAHAMRGWLDLLQILFIGHTSQKEKEHGHMVLKLRGALQKQSLDVRLKALFNVKGADYSSKPWDGADAACGYMFHDEKYVVFANVGFNDEDIKRFQDLNEKTQAVIAVNKEKGGNKNVEAVLEIFKDCEPTRTEIAKEFLRRVREGMMYDPGDWKLRSMTEEILMKLCTTEDEFDKYCFGRLANIFR